MAKKVIVIGAGIGGLGTAIQLAKKGYEVQIYEKTDKPGGRCQRIMKDGHIFDTGPTMYIFPELYDQFFAAIGEKVTDYVTLLPARPAYQLNFADNTSLQLTTDFEDMRKQLEGIEVGSYRKFQKYLRAGKSLYDYVIGSVIKKSMAKATDLFNLYNVVNIIKHNAILPHYLYTKRFFKNPKLNIAFTFQDSYLSLNPLKAPAMFSLFSYAELVNGNYLLKGGMYSLILAMVKIAEKYGVTITYSSPVQKIITENDCVKGVLLANGSMDFAEQVVVNADLPYAYEKLLPKDSYTQTLKRKAYSSSALVFHWALDKEYSQLQTHNLFFAEDYGKGFKEVLNQVEPPECPHFYVQAPSRTDKSRAPKGQDTWSVMIPINRVYEGKTVDWKTYKEKVREYVFARLAQAGCKEVRSHIKSEVCYLPTDWQSYFNLTNGSVYGLDHNLFQVGYLRPHRQHRKFKNLFFVGADTHPGSGLPTVLLSSQFTAESVLDYSNEK